MRNFRFLAGTKKSANAYIYLYLDKGPQSVGIGLGIWDIISYYTLATWGMWGPSSLLRFGILWPLELLGDLNFSPIYYTLATWGAKEVPK